MTNGIITRQITGALATGPTDVSSGLLPHNCLFWSRNNGAERLGIYVKPSFWTVKVEDNESLTIPFPGFVFIGQGQHYNIYAVKLPPTNLRSVLYNFPASNIDCGKICTGYDVFPIASSTTIWDAIYVFFGNRFGQGHNNGKSVKYTDDIFDRWSQLSATEAEFYPVGDLVASGKTLADIIGGR